MASRREAARRFARADHGNVGTLFAMMVIPVTLLGGGVVDVGRTMVERSRIQAAADAAALAAARPLEAADQDRIQIATTVFKANITSSYTPKLTPNVTIDGKLVKVEARSHVATPFLNLAKIVSLEANGHATAVAGDELEANDPGRLCLLALDPDSADGIHLQGDNQVNYVDCWAHTNSRLATAINASGSNARAVGLGHCAVGSWTQTHATFSPTPKAACREVRDPFATVGAYVSGATYSPSFAKPAKATTCKANSLNLKKGKFTLDPGRYCGGISIQAGATVTFNPGVYYIDNGLFKVQSGSSASGSNLLFYLEGAASRMEIIGGGTVDLSGRVNGSSYAGFLVIADANANRDGQSNIQGGGTFKLQGVVYMPTQRIEVAGNGDVNAAAINVFGMVAKDFYFRGNGVFNAVKHTGRGTIPNIMPDIPVRGIRETVLN